MTNICDNRLIVVGCFNCSIIIINISFNSSCSSSSCSFQCNLNWEPVCARVNAAEPAGIV